MLANDWCVVPVSECSELIAKAQESLAAELSQPKYTLKGTLPTLDTVLCNVFQHVNKRGNTVNVVQYYVTHSRLFNYVEHVVDASVDTGEVLRDDYVLRAVRIGIAFAPRAKTEYVVDDETRELRAVVAKTGKYLPLSTEYVKPRINGRTIGVSKVSPGKLSPQQVDALISKFYSQANMTPTSAIVTFQVDRDNQRALDALNFRKAQTEYAGNSVFVTRTLKLEFNSMPALIVPVRDNPTITTPNIGKPSQDAIDQAKVVE